MLRRGSARDCAGRAVYRLVPNPGLTPLPSEFTSGAFHERIVSTAQNANHAVRKQPDVKAMAQRGLDQKSRNGRHLNSQTID